MELETLLEPEMTCDGFTEGWPTEVGQSDPGGDEIIHSYARGDGTLLTVWLVQAGRSMATVRARGVDNAPLELDQLELIARRLSLLL